MGHVFVGYPGRRRESSHKHHSSSPRASSSSGPSYSVSGGNPFRKMEEKEDTMRMWTSEIARAVRNYAVTTYNNVGFNTKGFPKDKIKVFDGGAYMNILGKDVYLGKAEKEYKHESWKKFVSIFVPPKDRFGGKGRRTGSKRKAYKSVRELEDFVSSEWKKDRDFDKFYDHKIDYDNPIEAFPRTHALYERLRSWEGNASYLTDHPYTEDARFLKAEKLAKELEDKKRKRNLEKAGAVTVVLGFGASAFFLSSNLTGHTISNLAQANSNFIGVGLFLVAVVASLFTLKIEVDNLFN